MKIFNNPKYANKGEYPIDLNLKMDEDMEIKRLISTEVDHLIQIVFCKTDVQGQMYVCTWDLNRNMEYSNIEFYDPKIASP